MDYMGITLKSILVAQEEGEENRATQYKLKLQFSTD